MLDNGNLVIYAAYDIGHEEGATALIRAWLKFRDFPEGTIDTISKDAFSRPGYLLEYPKENGKKKEVLWVQMDSHFKTALEIHRRENVESLEWVLGMEQLVRTVPRIRHGGSSLFLVPDLPYGGVSSRQKVALEEFDYGIRVNDYSNGDFAFHDITNVNFREDGMCSNGDFANELLALSRVHQDLTTKELDMNDLPYGQAMIAGGNFFIRAWMDEKKLDFCVDSYFSMGYQVTFAHYQKDREITEIVKSTGRWATFGGSPTEPTISAWQGEDHYQRPLKPGDIITAGPLTAVYVRPDGENLLFACI